MACSAYERKQEFAEYRPYNLKVILGNTLHMKLKKDAAEYPEYEVRATLWNILHMKINKTFRFFKHEVTLNFIESFSWKIRGGLWNVLPTKLQIRLKKNIRVLEFCYLKLGTIRKSF